LVGTNGLIYVFENYALDTDQRELRRGAEPIAVEPQVFDLLLFLIRNRARVVSKDDLIAEVWNGRIVSESTLSSRITAVRQAIGDSGEEQRLIRTAARRGFRFVGDVREGQVSCAPSTHAEGGAGEQEVKSIAAATQTPAPGLPDKPSIAVLPFQNLSGDPEQDYFADGIVEDIITALSRLRWLFVIARNSSYSYKGRQIDLKQVGRELGVRYICEGAIRKAGSRVRITARLIDSEKGVHLWADRFDRRLTDIFAIQDEVTAKIVAVLAPEMTAAEITRAHRTSPGSVSAWDAYLRALPLMRQYTKAAIKDAIALLENAIALSPNFSAAHARLSACRTQTAYFSWEESGRDAITEALKLALRAIALDPEEPLAFDALASARQFLGEKQKAEEAARRAIELSPTCTAAYGTLITVLASQGRTEEALACFAQSERTSPRDIDRAGRLNGLVLTYFAANRYEEALAALEQYISLRPNHYGGHMLRAATLALTGQIAEAGHAREQLLRVNPHFRLEVARKRPSFTSCVFAESLFDGLRKAGLPER
jgi:TolB-like protein/Tfp pilus assembly protein PilF